ncbi:phage tail tape measure protein [Pseudoalteromonas ruthenica]|uniref:phage tail tape measure protein n=1 Tax=Pseudoalteromonas ruthenica TaxID=151081 RepID=UPI00110A88E1|nr:phage tail tape measure protein [Pseudoalteromonas ruthenica]TMO97545.1 phage tail tape measure protein [Pseudoalteromonas ruthenica]
MSSLSKLEKLMYSIGVVDKVTGPVNKIMGKIGALKQQSQQAMQQMTTGAMGAVAGVMALTGSLNPAIDQVAALGEVQSLGVANDALVQLTNTSYDFTTKFGGTSTEFIRSAYDIQSSISGITGDELSRFTRASNVLATATKADAATITDYVGRMYGIFQTAANELGKSKWVDILAGQTARAVQMYKTTGAEMSGAFANVGNIGTEMGVSQAQQIAVLGELQLVTKSGSVAGTQARAMYEGFDKARDKLGVELMDSQGQMLGIDVIITQINKRLEHFDAPKRLAVLTALFGKTGAAAVNTLSGKLTQLKTGYTELENITDATVANDMASIIASPWDRASASINAAMSAIGGRILVVFEPLVEVFSQSLVGVVNFTNEWPVLTSYIATGVVVIVGLITAVSMLNFVMGVYRMALVAVGAASSAHLVITKLWTAALFALRVFGFIANIAAMTAYVAVIGLFKGAMLAAKVATWAFNAALLANPIGLIIAAIVALIGVVVGLIVYWDEIVATFSKMAWVQHLITGFKLLIQPLNLIIDGVKSLLGWMGLLDGTNAEVTSKVNTDVTQNAKVNAATNAANDAVKNAMPGVRSNVVPLMQPPLTHVTNNQAQHSGQRVLNTHIQNPNNVVSLVGNVHQINPLSEVNSHTANMVALSANTQQSAVNSTELHDSKNDKSYAPSLKKSSVLQQIAHNQTTNSTNQSSDNSKNVYIDNLNMKSENLAGDFESLMELAG